MSTGKTATTLRIAALVACLVNEIPLNTSVRRKQWLMDGSQTLVGFLPVCDGEEGLTVREAEKKKRISLYRPTSSLTMPLESGLRVSADPISRE